MGYLHEGTLRKRRWWEKCKSQREWRTPGEQGSLHQGSKPHVGSQRLNQRAQSLHGSVPDPLCIYYSFQFSGFYGTLECGKECVFLILMPSLGLFSCCWFSLSNFNVMLFVFSYILFCYVLLLSLRSLFSSSERQKGNGSRWEGGGVEQGGVEGGETLSRMYHMSKESIFKKRGNTLKKAIIIVSPKCSSLLWHPAG